MNTRELRRHPLRKEHRQLIDSLELLSIYFPRAIATIVMLAMVLQPCHAQPTAVPDNSPAWFYSYDLFQMLLEEKGLSVTPALAYAYSTPRNTVVVIAGSVAKTIDQADWRRLQQFVASGGTLLLATEDEVSATGFGSFRSGPAVCLESANQYRSFPDCLMVAFRADETLPLNAATNLVFNRTGWFIPDSSKWKWDILARSPSNSIPSDSRGQALIAMGENLSNRPGRVIALSDASLLSNGMLWHGDNALAAIECCELLTKDGGKTRLVFVVNGSPLGSFHERYQVDEGAGLLDAPLPEPPKPELEQALSLANAIIKNVAESNVLNEGLKQRPRGISQYRYFNGLTSVIAILLAAMVLWLVVGRRLRRGIFVARPRMLAAFELSYNPRLQADTDYRLPAAQLARELCWELSGSRRSMDWKSLTEQLKATYSTRDVAELQRVVDIASRGCQSKLSRLDFELLGKSIRRLREKAPIATA